MKKYPGEKIGILGWGQIGKAISEFYDHPKIKDIKRDDELKGVEILHICIPYSINFNEIVKKEIAEIKPKLTIIHSTVLPGTTSEIGGMIVHSPVRGVHPDLYISIKTFTKYIGADEPEAAKKARTHFKELGIKSVSFFPSVTTELGKLFSTTYYGLCIAWHGEMKKVCDKAGLDFEQVVTHFNGTYREGYIKLDKLNVVRPILYPPPDNKIGGHCIVGNTHLLKNFMESKALDLILEYE